MFPMKPCRVHADKKLLVFIATLNHKSMFYIAVINYMFPMVGGVKVLKSLHITQHLYKQIFMPGCSYVLIA